jgi:outer membrane protein assembly factor BamB
MEQSLEQRCRRKGLLPGAMCVVAAIVACPVTAFSQKPAEKLILPAADAPPANRAPALAPKALVPEQPVARPAVPAAEVQLRGAIQIGGALRPGMGVEPTRGSSSPNAALNTSEELERLLEQATAVSVEKQRPDLAPPLWQRLLDEGANAFARAIVKSRVPLRRPYEIYRPFSNESLRAIVASGTEAVRYYRLYSDGPARALMAREGAEREAALAEVVRRYFLTSVGDDAAFELGCRLLERGDFISADQLFDRLSIYPDSNLDRNAIAVRRAVTQAHLGRTDVAVELVNSVQGDLESVKPLLVEEFKKGPSAPGVTSAGSSQAAELSISATALEPAWEYRPTWTLKGVKSGANNQAIMSGTVNGRPMIFVRQAGGNYVQTTLEDKDIPDIGFSQLASQWRNSGWRPASSPLVVDGRIYLKSESRTVCCDVKTGAVLWMGRPTRFPIDDWSRQLAMVAAHGVNVSYPTTTYMAGPQPKTMTEMMLFSDRLHHALTVSDGRVFAIEGELDTPATRKTATDTTAVQRGFIGGETVNRTQSRHNALACYDAVTGRFLWAVGRGTGLPEGAALWSKPLIVGPHVFVTLGIDSQLALAAIDIATGKVIWTTTLADLGRAAPTIPVGMIVDDGSIYVASGAGTLFSVDRNGGALRWAASYPRLKSAAYDRRAVDGSTGERVQIVLDENFVAREDDLLIVAASDSDHLMAFNVTDGSLRWDSPLPPQVLTGSLGYVVGLGNGRIHLANNKWLWTVATKGGRIVWDLALDGASGRGVLAGDALFVPQSATILQLDAARGTERSKIAVATPDSEPVGNLLAGEEGELLVASAARLLAMKPKANESKSPQDEKKLAPEGKDP